MFIHNEVEYNDGEALRPGTVALPFVRRDGRERIATAVPGCEGRRRGCDGVRMEVSELREILHCLGGARRVFPYFKDRYALKLLSWFVREGKHVRDIKASRFGGLLRKGVVREVASGSPDGMMRPEDFEGLWPRRSLAYVLTLGRWPGSDAYSWEYRQTSRPGVNIVLRLNFSSEHDRQYFRAVGPDGAHRLEYYGHPHDGGRFHTLAWSRIDLDLASGEALIEEVQTDWLRAAQRWRDEAVRLLDEPDASSALAASIGVERCTPEEFLRYVDCALAPHADCWSEALLLATVEFIRTEIGIDNIYMHTFDGGNRLKRVAGRYPPRSLYTDLPRSFCFREVDEWPDFLRAAYDAIGRSARKRSAERAHVRAVRGARFHRLDIQ